MNILAIDIGNTRTKWKLFGREVVPGVFGSSLPCLEELRAFLGRVDIIVCGSVRGEQINDNFSRRCKEALDLKPNFLSVQSAYGDLRNGYEYPAKMGVDRWLAMVSARDQVSGELLLVDAGTAVTVDVVDGQGQHRGGYIVPGLAGLVESLNNGTGLITVSEREGSGDLRLGVDTALAVVNGCTQMLVSFINEECRARPDASLVLTGGGAQALIKHLPSGAVYLPDLVLDGIFLVAVSEL